MAPTPSAGAVLVAPLSFTNAATASGYVDRKGYDYVEIDVALGCSNNVTNNPSVLKLSEGDTTSSFATWSGSVGDTDFTIPNSLTTTNLGQLMRFGIDCRGRKRYLKVEVSPVTTQLVSVTANMRRYGNAEAPITAAKAGLDLLVNL